MAKSIYLELQKRPAYLEVTTAEQSLISFVQENKAVITVEFSLRLEKAVANLQNLDTHVSSENQRIKISELLHEIVIKKIRSILGEILEKKNRVAILIDNLDKAWNRESDLRTLSDLLFELLEVSESITKDFSKSDSWRRPVNLSLVIFLRNDIFNQIIQYSREKDKIQHTRITWEDPDLLLSVLEERLRNCTNIVNPDLIWKKYFCENVKGTKTKEYLINLILPKPRDLIFFAKEALNYASNRKHSKVEEVDILDAEKLYSRHAIDSLVVENGNRIEKFEEIIFEFVKSNEIIDTSNILEAIKVNELQEGRLDDIINILCELSFIGLEVDNNRFEFIYKEADTTKLQIMARKTSQLREDKKRRFKINKPFHAYLEIICT